MSETELFETRLYVTGALSEGLTVALSTSQAHQVRTVQRLKPDSLIALFNGQDGEWLGRLLLDRKTASVELIRQSAVQTIAADLWLLFAPIKNGRIDFLVEKATELGVGRLLPVITERTQMARVNTDRLWQNAREAAEQCERLDVPDIAEPVKLEAMLKNWDPERTLFVCAERGEARPIVEALIPSPSGRGEGEGLINSLKPDCPSPVRSAIGRPLPRGEVQKMAFLIGPEGGFSPAEFDSLRRCAFVIPVSLGRHILRAETAAIAALSVWNAIGYTLLQRERGG